MSSQATGLKRKSPDDDPSTITVGSGGLKIRFSRNANTNTHSNNEQQYQPGKEPGDQEKQRPIRSNRGQGGHIEQTRKYLTTAAKKQWETSNKSSSGINTTRDMPDDLPENPNAPPLKKPRNVKKPAGDIGKRPNHDPIQNPVVLAPKPRAQLAPAGSGFGFVPQNAGMTGKAPSQHQAPAAAASSPPRTTALPESIQVLASSNAALANMSPAFVEALVAAYIKENNTGLTTPAKRQDQAQNAESNVLGRDDTMPQDNYQSIDGPSGGHQISKNKSAYRERPTRKEDQMVVDNDGDEDYEGNDEEANEWGDGEGDYEADEDPNGDAPADEDDGGDDMYTDNEHLDGDRNGADNEDYAPQVVRANQTPFGDVEEDLEESQQLELEVSPARRLDNLDMPPDEDSYNVLEQHHSINRPRRPPNPADLAIAAHKQAAYLDNNSEVDNDSSIEQDDNDEEADETENHHDRRPRNTVNPKGRSSALNVLYYGPTFKRALVRAKHDWRHYLATENPWPVRRDHFGKATTFLGRRIKESQDEGAFLEDHPQDHRMDSVIFNESSTFRGVIKSHARQIVKIHYANIIDPQAGRRPSENEDEDGSEDISENQQHIQQIIRDGIREILDDCTFHVGGLDKNGKTENFAHPALKALVHEVFYKGKDSLAKLYPGSFSHSVPIVAVILAATAIHCALDEYLDLSASAADPIPFTAAEYEHIYDSLMSAYEQIIPNAYHNGALHARLQEWARSGIAKYCNTKKKLVKSVKVILD